MENQPRSTLANFKENTEKLSRIIARRQNLATRIQQAQISREDPDLEIAARNHAQEIVEIRIPLSIKLFNQKLATLKGAQAAYTEMIADDLVATAQSYTDRLANERKVVARIDREYRRGYSTQEVLDRRQAQLRELEATSEADLELQAGLKLIEQRRLEVDNQIESPKAVIETIVEGELSCEILPGDAIPSLLPQLDHIASMHEHKYNLDNTISKQAEAALVIAEYQRTETQKQLLADQEEIKRYIPRVSFEEVYSPEELHSLLAKLQLLSQKNRPDFDELEGKILDVLKQVSEEERHKWSPTLIGLVKRAEKDLPNRRGMQWNTLEDCAKQAHEFIVFRNLSIEIGAYFVHVVDPDATSYPDLSAVYQIVADMHALEVIGQRSFKVDNARRESFVSNCEVVNKWFEAVDPILDGMQDRRSQALRYHIGEMVKSMNRRLSGEFTSGQDQDYRIKPSGAISLQKKIGHAVEELKAHLNVLAHPELSEEIVPLD